MKKKKLPTLKSDRQAERFVAESDLTEDDLSGFKPVHFEFDRKTAKIKYAPAGKASQSCESKSIP